MSIRPTIRRATVAGAVAALSLSLLPALATSASAANPSPDVAFTFLTRHSPAIAGDGKVQVNPKQDLSTSSPLLPTAPNTFAYSFDVSEDGDTAAYLAKTTDALGDFIDTSSGLVVVDRGASSTTAKLVATWTDTNPVVSPDGSKVWWITGDNLYQYDVALGSTTDLGQGFATKFDSGATPPYYEIAKWMTVSDSGSSVAVTYDRYNLNTNAYLGTRVYAAKAADPANFSYESYVAAGGEIPTSSTFVFTDDTTLLYSVNNSSPETFTTKKATLDAVHNTVAAGPGAYYQIENIGGTWYFWKDDISVDPMVTSVGTTNDPTVAPTEWFPRPDGDSTVRYVPSSVEPPALPAALDTARTTFTAFLNLSTSTVNTGGKAYYLAGGQWGPVGPDPLGFNSQQNFKGQLQYSLNGTTGWTTLRTTTGTISTGPGTSRDFNGLTQSLTRNTWFRWYHPQDLFTNARYTTARKVSVKPSITILKAKSGTKTKVYGKISRVGGTAILYKKSSTGAYVKAASTTIGSTGSYSFGYRSLSRGTYRVASVASTYWAANYKNFTI